MEQKSTEKYICFFCDFNTSRKSHYERHILTPKHRNVSKMIVLASKKVPEKYMCNCGKKYKHDSSYYRHKKNCEEIDKKIFEESDKKNFEGNNKKNFEENYKINEKNSNDIIVELLKQNHEFKDMIIEQNKKIIELVSNNNVINNTINNTTNNNFNLQIFLNEKCKDAPNLIDFINSIQLKLTDFENFGTFGYADNISRILLREIKDVDIYKRPIHCSDLKREVIHVKDENAWKKDEDKKHMKKAIKEIAYKNFKTIIPEWVKANPESKDITTKKHDEYIKMMSNSMGELTEEGDEKNYNKIIRNVAKEILVEK